MSAPVAVKERPILFSGEMVRAILDGRKSQTRRVMQSQPYVNGFRFDKASGHLYCHNDYLPPSVMLLDVGRGANRYTTSDAEEGGDFTRLCPYGAVGDRLWVKETFMGPDHISDGDRGLAGHGILYRADDSFVEHGICACEGPCSGVRIWHDWKPSIFMRREYSRLTLEITDVRVERVQDICETDAIAEGIDCQPNPDWKDGDDPWTSARPAIDVYRELWDSLNAKRGYSWESNPFVWVIAFSRVPLGRAE